jgi:hypothetical protein
MTHTKDEALHLALKALRPFSTPNWAGTGVDKANEAITAIKQALAQTAPVRGFIKKIEDLIQERDDARSSLDAIKQTLAQPAPVQSVASLKEVDVLMMAETHGIDPNTKGLYGFYIDCISNQPAEQRQWVGLSQEEIENCYGGEIDDFARAIEAKLKEKNT